MVRVALFYSIANLISGLREDKQILISTAVFHVILVEMCLGNLASHRDIVGKNGGLTNSLSHKCGFFPLILCKDELQHESETLSTFGIFYLRLTGLQWMNPLSMLDFNTVHCSFIKYWFCRLCNSSKC